MPPRGPTPPWGDEQRGGGETMTEVETKVFDNESLGRRIMRKKVLGKIPALPLITLLVVASFAAAAFYALGPGTNASVQLGSMTSAGLPTGDVLYGQTLVLFYLNITVATNSYTASHTAHVVLTVQNTGLTSVAACNAALTVFETNNVTTVYNAITPPTQAGTTCTYTGLVTQTVNAGRITTSAPNWPMAIEYMTAPTGTYAWTSTLYGN